MVFRRAERVQRFQGPKPPMARIRIDKSKHYERANWFDTVNFWGRRYMKDPIARGWVQMGEMPPPPPK